MDKKLCPFCGEEIMVSAKKCKHCGEWLVDEGITQKVVGFDSISLIKRALASKYEVLEMLGMGGMAEVYKARHKSLNRIIALKILHQNLVHDKEFLERFNKEAQLSASLNHPNIVNVYDIDQTGDYHYLAMEYLEGNDLHSIIKNKGNLTVDETLSIIIPIADALDHAHGKGIIHRDIKSSNILFTRSGKPVLADFGIAHAASGSKLTQTGIIIGTPEYMSPEQAQGKLVDGRSDFFSLGVVMYECLTGDVPFKADSPLSVISKIINERPLSESYYRIGLPSWVEEILDNLLEKQSSKRCASGEELIYMLQQHEYTINKNLFERKPSDKSKVNSIQKERKSRSRIALFAVLTILVAITVIFILFFGKIGTVRVEPAKLDSSLNDNLPGAVEKLPFAKQEPQRKKSTQPIERSQVSVKVQINSTPQGAEVFLDGIRYHTTPCNLELLVGKYNLRLEKEGYNSFSKNLSIDTIKSVYGYTLKQESQQTGSFTDSRDGHTYKWVKIGKQVWMAENLAYLPLVSPSAAGSKNSLHYYVYGYEGTVVSEAKATNNYRTYGVLYNWQSAKNSCPIGWHLPEDAEWTELINYIGGESAAGGSLKDDGDSWTVPNTGANNSSGFSALPGGYRSSKGIFYFLGYRGYWWSSTGHNAAGAWVIVMRNSSGVLDRNNSNEENGFSVRCIRD